MRGRHLGEPTAHRDDRHDFWGVVLDAPDAPELARFYADLLGWELQVNPEGTFATLAPPDGVAYLAVQHSEGFQSPVWPNADGQQQMMVHLDFEVSDLAAAAQHAVDMGARLAAHQPQENVRVLIDPVGHPFCVYRG